MSLHTPDSSFSFDTDACEPYIPYELSEPNFADEAYYTDVDNKEGDGFGSSYSSCDDLFDIKPTIKPEQGIQSVPETPRLAQMLAPLQNTSRTNENINLPLPEINETFKSNSYSNDIPYNSISSISNSSSSSSYKLFNQNVASPPPFTCIMTQSPFVVLPFQQYNNNNINNNCTYNCTNHIQMQPHYCMNGSQRSYECQPQGMNDCQSNYSQSQPLSTFENISPPISPENVLEEFFKPMQSSEIPRNRPVTKKMKILLLHAEIESSKCEFHSYGRRQPVKCTVMDNFQPISCHANSVCTNCGTRETTLWRRSADGSVECNACNLYFRKNNRKRPISMKKAIRKRVRIPREARQ
ncbi:unnamed protein product [Anisakis simplex]|uniref:GATA-type domain-containing protein n=1 Tax=Anisakis simplex TaxID=6269 RepID=A0A0M3JX12_ANISI|nr:unnamed protein product [Anisakis simplex]